MKQIQIYTDGSCLGNPGAGGYGAILRYQTTEKTLSAGFFHTTNNRMELLAVIAALESLNQPCLIELYSDSQYMKNGITKWIQGWKKKGWQSSSGQPVKNKDLWLRLEAATQSHQIQWRWVKGHSGHPENERCDELARQAAQQPQFEDSSWSEHRREERL